jgi:hypothetical protein
MAPPRPVFRMRAAKRWLPRAFFQRNREGDAPCDDPFSSDGGVSVASARATQSHEFAGVFRAGVAMRSSRARSRPCRETSRVPPSARESQNVPVSYPRRIDIAPLQATQHAHLQGFCASPLTDSNRRPPPYHVTLAVPHGYRAQPFRLAHGIPAVFGEQALRLVAPAFFQDLSTATPSLACSPASARVHRRVDGWPRSLEAPADARSGGSRPEKR